MNIPKLKKLLKTIGVQLQSLKVSTRDISASSEARPKHLDYKIFIYCSLNEHNFFIDFEVSEEFMSYGSMNNSQMFFDKVKQELINEGKLQC